MNRMMKAVQTPLENKNGRVMEPSREWLCPDHGSTCVKGDHSLVETEASGKRLNRTRPGSSDDSPPVLGGLFFEIQRNGMHHPPVFSIS